MILVGIDDTDIVGSRGTNKLARILLQELAPQFPCTLAVRHQLLLDPRVPYTSKNSSASLRFDHSDPARAEELTSRLRQMMQREMITGSDPGLAVATAVPAEVSHFGCRCQSEVVTQDEARSLAEQHGIYLEGLGGTEDGVIGALAALGLAASGNDGRVVNLGIWPDDLAGPQDAALLRTRGVEDFRHAETGTTVEAQRIDVGKHLRPNYRDGKVVLFVTPSTAPEAAAPWAAVRFA